MKYPSCSVSISKTSLLFEIKDQNIFNYKVANIFDLFENILKGFLHLTIISMASKLVKMH